MTCKSLDIPIRAMNLTTEMTKDLFTEGPHAFTDEIVFREMIKEIVHNASLVELQQLFEMTKIDPFSEESQEKMYAPSNRGQDRKERNFLRMLENKGVIRFEVKSKL